MKCQRCGSEYVNFLHYCLICGFQNKQISNDVKISEDKKTSKHFKISDLTKVKGIGPKLSQRLKSLGIKTVQALSMYEVDDLAQITGVSEKRADDWIKKAKEIISIITP
jgi:predicted flap endonuclease-1-like 5' DNA nuclease